VKPTSRKEARLTEELDIGLLLGTINSAALDMLRSARQDDGGAGKPESASWFVQGRLDEARVREAQIERVAVPILNSARIPGLDASDQRALAACRRAWLSIPQ
jgi:hypothetical protein